MSTKKALRHQHLRAQRAGGARLLWPVLAALALSGAVLSSLAAASTVTPIDQSVVTRVGTVVSLDRSGTQIAFSATSTAGNVLGDSVFAADADGSNMRRIGGSDAGVYQLIASGDRRWLAYQAVGFVTDLGAPVTAPRIGIIDVSSGKLRHIGFAGAAHTQAILAGRASFYATPERGAAFRLNPLTGAARRVRLVGTGAALARSLEEWVPSNDHSQAAVCSAGRTSNVRRTIGVLDLAAGVVRTAGAPLQGWSGCQVSDDGSTVATVGLEGGRPRLFALRHGRSRLLALDPDMREVVALSPSGRYALVRSGDFHPESGDRVELLDLDSHRLHVLHGIGALSEWEFLNSPTAFATWSKDEQTAVIVAIRWQGHGSINNPASARLLAVSTRSGAVLALARPAAPPGMRFTGTPAPQAFTDDGQAVGVTVPTSARTTDWVPYRVALNGHGAELLFTGSVRSFGSVSRSLDGSHAWIAAGWSCSSSYRFPLMSLAGTDVWASPWKAA